MERRHEVTRLEGFSDAVFGFALTLLVVSLEVPGNVTDLINNMRGFLPFALMFAMICWIWYEHQQFFRRYGLQDAWTIALNSFLLFVVLFYVYPLKYLTIHLVGPFIGMLDPATGQPISRGMEHGDLIMMMYSAGLGVASIVIVIIAQRTEIWNLVAVAGVIYSLMGPLHAWNGYASGKAHDQLRKSGAVADAKR